MGTLTRDRVVRTRSQVPLPAPTVGPMRVPRSLCTGSSTPPRAHMHQTHARRNCVAGVRGLRLVPERMTE